MWVRTMRVVALALPLAWLLPDAVAAQSATATGISREFNPALSLNALLLYRSGVEADAPAEHDEPAPGDGFSIQELELQLTASVDPYVKANFILAMHGTEGIELEEGFGQALFLPKGLGMRAGKIYFEFGKHNVYHTHQYPFVERPYAWDSMLGDHGLNGAALEASWLTPLPWYAEVIAETFPLTEAIYGDHDIPRNTWGGGARLRQLWDVSEQATFDCGVSYAAGDAVSRVAGDPDSLRGTDVRHFLGLDLTYKWTGGGAHPKSFELQVEWLRRGDGGLDGRRDDGWYAHALARVARRLVVGARVDGFDGQDSHAVRTYTASLAFVPSEFQAIRIDGLRRDSGSEDDAGLRVQYNLTIGSHPAHRY